jgi:hypothetical protein
VSETTTVPPSELLTAPELAERVTGGPVTIMVPDFGDPCGTRKIPRLVRAAVSADVPNGLGGMTAGRWQLFFDGPYVIPLILVTTGDWAYEVTNAAPAVDSGPCPACQALAREQAAQERQAADLRDAEQAAENGRRATARQAGYDDGYAYESNVDVAGFPPVDWETVPVPDWYADQARYYRSGWDAGRQAYEDEDHA